MKLGVRAKLFAVSVGLVVAVVLAAGFYLRGELRGLLLSRIEGEILRHARTVRALVEARTTGWTIAEVDPLCDRLGVAAESRITIVRPDGTLLCDSELSPAEVETAQNHARRPEVLEASALGQGSSTRWSTTIQTDMLYVAVPYDRAGEHGVVRAAKPLRSVDQAVGRLRMLLLVAGLVGLIVAVAMSWLASHYLSRTLRSLVVSARAIAGGHERQRLTVTSGDELAGLAGSLNKLAENLEDTVGELAAERARFKDVYEGLGEAVVAIDSERDVQLMNAAALEMLGLAEVPAGKPLLEILRTPALQDLIEEPVRKASAEFGLPGSNRMVLARVAPLGQGRGAVLIMHDVTEIRRLETIRSDFVANVSHELRTPVSIIRANTETLLDGAMADPVHGVRLLSAAHRSSERLSNIINDLLELSRLEAGQSRPELTSIQVAPVVRLASEFLATAARERNTTVELTVPEDLRASADAHALEQILVNYLDNAIKYSPAGGHLVVRSKSLEGRVRLEVCDDGPGIEGRHRQRVFERFYRVDPGRSRDMGGTGLGLSIVKHLAESMGAEVGAEPNMPKGSIFWIEIPTGA